MSKTIRLMYPDWQSGDNPVYYFGAQLLDWLAPQNPQQKSIRVPVSAPQKNQAKLALENGVTAQSEVLENVHQARTIVDAEQPDRIITLGGNCMVSQVPFSYLHDKYGDDVGIIWIDAHPDISNPQMFSNEHAMVLANLMGKGDPDLSQLVQHPFSSESILYVGLQEPTADEKELLPELGLDYQLEDNQQVDVEKVQTWIDQHHFDKILVHFDIDVLDRNLFFDQYFDKPGVTDYGVAGGKLSPDKAMRVLNKLGSKNDIVGLTIAEYLPWSALKLKELMENISIFKLNK